MQARVNRLWHGGRHAHACLLFNEWHLPPLQSGMRKCLLPQGDVTSGSTATMLAWATTYGSAKGLQKPEDFPGGLPPTMLAAYGGCYLVRRASEKAFRLKRRSMVAGDLIEHLGPAFAEIYDTDVLV